MAKDKTPAHNLGVPISEVFQKTVTAITNQMRATKHEFAVDLEISFKAMQLDKRGFPLLTKSSKQSQLEIKIATRINPAPAQAG